MAVRHAQEDQQGAGTGMAEFSSDAFHIGYAQRTPPLLEHTQRLSRRKVKGLDFIAFLYLMR